MRERSSGAVGGSRRPGWSSWPDPGLSARTAALWAAGCGFMALPPWVQVYIWFSPFKSNSWEGEGQMIFVFSFVLSLIQMLQILERQSLKLQGENGTFKEC